MAVTKINLKKKVYKNNTANNYLNPSFSEFIKVPFNINVDRFFELYEKISNTLPEKGEKSHETFVKQSNDYLNN